MEEGQELKPPSSYNAGLDLDDDGREPRKGTVVTASAHIITAVIGSGVLSLAWDMAQLGWVIGTLILVAFSVITYYTSTMLADCYRAPDPVTGHRNYTYMNVVRAYLGEKKVKFCGMAQFGNLIGVTVGYTITASISMVAIMRSNCFHKHGHNATCQTSNNPFMIMFGIIQIVLSQIPNFHKLTWLSIVASVMSFTYSLIGLGLSIASVAGAKHHAKTSIMGTQIGVDVTASEKLWNSFQAIGDIAFAYTYAPVLVEIQDTLKSTPPENKTMKRASLVGVSTTSFFYILCGCVGYAAFGNKAPGNFLTGFGFYEPFWLIDFANICIAVHLIGAYQVFCQPIFDFVEKCCISRWPDNKFITRDIGTFNIPGIGLYHLNLFRLVWRTLYVVMTFVLAMLFPFFNVVLGLIGSLSYWPLSVYFPIEMHISQAKIPKYSIRWLWLKAIIFFCFAVSLVAMVGSAQGLVMKIRSYKPFHAANE